MFNDLVHGGGCAEDGPGGGANALSKLSGALGGFGQEQRVQRSDGAGPSSAFAGPSGEMLPPPSAEEAAFLDAFAADQRMGPGGPSAEMAWHEAAAALGFANQQARMHPMDAQNLAAADAAWAAGAYEPHHHQFGPGLAAPPAWPAPTHPEALQLAPSHNIAAQRDAGAAVRGALRLAEVPGGGSAVALAADPGRWDALRALGLPPQQLDAAVRRADQLLGQLHPRQHAAADPPWRSQHNVDDFTAGTFHPGPMRQRQAPGGWRAGAPPQQPFAQRSDVSAPASSAAAAVLDEAATVQAVWAPSGGDMVAEMEAAWAAAAPGQGSSLQFVGKGLAPGAQAEALIQERGGAVSGLEAMDAAWDELSIGDSGAAGMDKLWESLQESGHGEDAFRDAWDAASTRYP